jgi:hypothetical protein
MRRLAERLRTTIAVAFGLFFLLTTPRTLMAAPVTIPLHVNYALMSDMLRQQLYTRGGRAQLWNGNNDCEYLYAENPSFGQRNGVLLIDTEAYLNLGVPVGDRCLTPITWSGIVESDTAPYIAGFALKLHVTDTNLYDRNHKQSLLLGRGFDLIKDSVTPAFETYSFDLMPAIRELDRLAGMGVAAADEAALHLALATIRLAPTVTVEETGVQLRMTIDLPPQAPSTPIPASAAPLKPEEIAAWNNALDSWDAFFVFAIKQVGATVSDPNVREQLLSILLDGRQRLVAALAQPQRLTDADPVRLLFLDEWTRLGQVIESAAEKGRLGNHALEFLSFISAGDALFALDKAASALGLRISADDLRRLARIMAPQAGGDPLAYSFEEDPQLREIFGLGTPLQEPEELDMPAESGPATSHNAPGQLPPADVVQPVDPKPARGNPTGGSAPRSDGPKPSLNLPSPITGQLSMFALGLCSLSPAAASAAETAPKAEVGTSGLLALGRKLHGVVVSESNSLMYQRELGQLLDLAAHYQFQDDAPEVATRRSWPILLKAAAWQESCWRQYVLRHGRIWFLESGTGDIGLMQVNKYVWRGFYSLARLRWDIVYNLSAGSEILHRLLAGSFSHLHSDNPSVLARSAYAAYNGGPSAYNRWRQPDEPRALRAIDQAFWMKYQATAAGQPFDILSCASEWDRLHAD